MTEFDGSQHRAGDRLCKQHIGLGEKIMNVPLLRKMKSTSRSIWVTLETLFSARSQSRILQLKQQLSNLKKGAQSISGYFQKAQGFAHLLAAIGKPIDNSELIFHILAGLGAEYDPLVTSVTTRQDSISLNDLYSHMYVLKTINQRQRPSYQRNNRG